MSKKHEIVDRKFIESIELSDWEVETDTGWENITHFNTTVEYEVWEIETDKGTVIKGADTHIFIDSNHNEIFLKDSLNCDILSTTGSEHVISVKNLGFSDNMYDLTVDSDNHTYYTDGLLSHNTTVATGYLLWYAMFMNDSTILITSNKFDSALEIMHRMRYAYECVPDHIRAGVSEYNKKSMAFDNGSRIISTTTTETTGRGMSLSLVYCLDGNSKVMVRDKETGEVKQITLTDLHNELKTSGDANEIT